jgi:gliding motility-associated-like protein
LEFAIFPKSNNQEIDWALYDITNGCPGSELACNYQYSRGIGVTGPSGMWDDASVYPDPLAFNGSIPVVAGRTYVLLIDDYGGNSTGYKLYWGGSFDISTKANFIADKVFDCEPFTANFQNQSVGAQSYVWSFPDGSTSTDTDPSFDFTNPGQQSVNLTASNSRSKCTSTFSSRFIVNPLKFTNSDPQVSLCLGKTHTFSNQLDTLLLSSPVRYEFNVNRSFNAQNPQTGTGLVQNVFPQQYVSGDLEEVCISLRHRNLKELEIDILSPSGTRLKLIEQNDLQGQAVDNLCFHKNSNIPLNTVAAPYAAQVKPKFSFDSFIGDNKEGFWTIDIRDATDNNSYGFFDNWSLTFFTENKTTVAWTPVTYLDNDSILNPTITAPNSLVQDETIFYDIKVTDHTSCADISVTKADIIVSSYAGSDSSLYFCKDLSQINLFDILSPEATQDGKWYDDNRNEVTKFFDPSLFFGQSIVRWYKIVGPSATCGEDSSRFVLTIRPDSSIQYNYPATLCDGKSFTVDVNSNLTGFTQFFASYPSRDSSIILNNFPNNFTVKSSQLPFTVDSIKFDQGKCTLPSGKLIMPTLVDQPRLRLDSTTCNETSTSYIAYVSVEGGETSSLEVNGQNASSRKVISAPIATGTDFLFECSDANFCNIDSLTVNVKCNCKSFAGTVKNQNENFICDNDTLILEHNQDQFEDPNDISEIIITAAPFPSFGGIVDRILYQPSYKLWLKPPFQLGQSYYITTVTGSKDINQRVDLQDPCLSYTRSIKFTFTQSPKGSVFLGLNSVCKNQPVPINFQLTNGIPDFYFYRDGELINQGSVFNGSFDFTFSNDTVFFIDSIVSSNGCVGYDFAKDSSRVNVVDYPEFDNIQFTCDNTGDNFTLGFDIIDGDEPSLDITSNVTLSNSGRSYQSISVPTGASFNISAKDKNNCETTTLDTAYSCPCISVAPQLNPFPNSGTYCTSDNIGFSAVDNNNDGYPDGAILDGNDTLSLLIVNNISDTGLRPIPFVKHSNNFTFPAADFTPGLTYHVFLLVGNKDGSDLVDYSDDCVQYSSSRSFTVVQNGTLFTSGTDSLCVGESLRFGVNNSSAFSVDFVIQHNGSAESFNITAPPGNSSHNIAVTGTGIKSYFVSPNFTDNSPAQCMATWLGDSLKAAIIPSPELSFLNTNDKICPGENFTINYSLTTNLNAQYDVNLDGQLLESIINSAGTYSYVFAPSSNGVFSATNLFTMVGTKKCYGTITNSAQINVFSEPVFDVDYSPLPPCIGDMVSVEFQSNKTNFDLDYFTQTNQTVSASGQIAQFNYTINSLRDSIKFMTLISQDQSDQSLAFCAYNVDTTLYMDAKAKPSVIVTPLFSNPICENDTAFFQFDVTGQPLISIDIQVDGASKTLQSASNSFTDFVVVGNSSFNYDINLISDNFCSSVVNQSFNVIPTAAAIANVKLEALNNCEPAVLEMSNASNNLTNCVWQNQNDSIISNACSGAFDTVNAANAVNYTFSYSDNNGCTNTITTNDVDVLESPFADFDFSPSFPTITSPRVQTRNLSSNYSYSTWFVNDLFNSNEDSPGIDLPAQIDVPFELKLVVEHLNGCTDTSTQTLMLEPNLSVYFPSAFTPDNDGINDCFQVKSDGAALEGFYLKIYDRWGSLVHETNNLNDCWDGTFKGEILPIGMYSLQLRIYTSTLNSFEEYTGRVYIVR